MLVECLFWFDTAPQKREVIPPKKGVVAKKRKF